MSKASDGPLSRVEVITSVQRRRRWSTAEKVRLGEEAMQSRMSVSLGETLRNWVRQAERDQRVRAGATSEERDRIKALEREVRELHQAGEILLKASAYSAQAELDRLFRR